MSSETPNFEPMLRAIPNRTVPSNIRNGSLALAAIGIVASLYGFLGGDAELVHRAQGAFITNFMYFNCIATGGFLLATIGMVTHSRWPRRFKRLSEAFAMFMPVTYVLLIAFLLLGGIDAYPWAHESMPPHKAIYFDKTFYIARLVIGLGILIALSQIFVRASLRADIGVAKEEMSKLGLAIPEKWESMIGGWSGADAEVQKAQSKMLTMSPIIIVAYALIFSMVSVDVSMSLAPHFFANMFPAWYFMSAIWSGLVYLAIFSILGSKWLGTSNLMKLNFYHDIGKLTFAFCMFWGYTTFAQYLPIWYGNMTEEIGYILYRTHGEVFGTMSMVTLVLCFAAPWSILLSRELKKQPKSYVWIIGMVAVGIWCERYIVNMPSIHSYHMHESTSLPLGIVEIGMSLGFLGLFIYVVTNYLKDKPGAVISDPLMQPDPEHVHVHPHVAEAHH